MRRWSQGRRVERKRFDHGAPIAKIDTRPMVFVVMFVVVMYLLLAAKPILQTTNIDLWFDGSQGEAGSNHFSQVLPEDWKYHGVIDRLEIDQSERLIWNGQVISLEQLEAKLEKRAALYPAPIIEFNPAPKASYDLVARTLGSLSKSGAEFRLLDMGDSCGIYLGPRVSEFLIGDAHEKTYENCSPIVGTPRLNAP